MDLRRVVASSLLHRFVTLFNSLRTFSLHNRQCKSQIEMARNWNGNANYAAHIMLPGGESEDRKIKYNYKIKQS